MWLVLCAPDDLPALWAYQGLKARGFEPLELVSGDMLACSLRWEHRLASNGASTEIHLSDGRKIKSEEISGVINRLVFARTDHLLLANPTERIYAIQELYALYLSWLYALPVPVLNLPTPQGLSGQWRHMSEWVLLASRAGLPTTRYYQSGRDCASEAGFSQGLDCDKTIIVINRQVIDHQAPPEIVQGCRRLAEISKTEILGVDFSCSLPEDWSFAGATPMPDLRKGGERFLDALAVALRNGRKG